MNLVQNESKPHSASFRDPSGFLFHCDGELFRQVNKCYRENYEQLQESGLYQRLINANLLVSHEEIDRPPFDPGKAYKILRPRDIPFISYPYEWSFSQLKAAALLTLEIQRIALDFGMILKDSSAYNIQYSGPAPIFIDTLSFDKYKEGEPWVAYRQFCQHFLAPLALMSYRDVRLSQLLKIYIDGIPLDLASSLLPFRSRLSFSIGVHIHLHARSQKKYADSSCKATNRKVGQNAFRGLIDSLESAVKKLTWNPGGTEWGEYYKDTNYSSGAMEKKRRLVGELLDEINPEVVWDLGANIGIFSRISSDKGIPTISFDIDPAAVEKNYLEVVKKREENILPLLMDLTNPSSGIGWANEERMSLIERSPADAVLALALIHHLTISNNLPFGKTARFFSRICRHLIIEFVPKTDSQVQRLLSTREDIFLDYTKQAFEKVYSEYFRIIRSHPISNSERILYLMSVL